MCTQHIGKSTILFTVFLTLSTALPLESSLRKDNSGCYPHEFRCHNRYYCINSRYVCDEIDDCGDLSDESNCSNKKCFHGEFLCSSNGIYVCHPNHYKCDGEPDCDDQSDERNCKPGGRGRDIWHSGHQAKDAAGRGDFHKAKLGENPKHDFGGAGGKERVESGNTTPRGDGKIIPATSENNYANPIFRSASRIILESSDLDEEIAQMEDKIKESMEAFNAKGSGWTFGHIEKLEIQLNEHKPLKGSSYIPLPKKLAAKKAIVNVKMRISSASNGRSSQPSITRRWIRRAATGSSSTKSGRTSSGSTASTSRSHSGESIGSRSSMRGSRSTYMDSIWGRREGSTL
ncbi:LRP1B [Mytilus edulis]|uniref:LRP1B n=1 Tax=Mytilus edulis TaxID=6550 RepID=A0A8S3S2M9_MYTED|nr:LRP1B [Mytilus edulis]